MSELLKSVQYTSKEVEGAKDSGNSAHVNKLFLTNYLEVFSQVAERDA